MKVPNRDITVREIIGLLWWASPIAIIKDKHSDVSAKELKSYALFYDTADKLTDETMLRQFVLSYGMIGRRFVIIIK